MFRKLEKFYPFCPVWLQNLGISIYGYFYKKERLGKEFELCTKEFQKRDRWTEHQMNDYLNERLQVQIRLASEAPYYKEKWGKLGITSRKLKRITLDSLYHLPVLPKLDLVKYPAFFVPTSIRKSHKLLNYFTSGSTGSPIRAIYTKAAHQRFWAAREARSFGWAGTSIKRPRAMIGGRSVVPWGIAKPPLYRYNLAERQVYFSAYHISPGNISNYVEGLNHYRPELITGYAYSQFFIAKMMVDYGINLNYMPLASVTSSEKLTDQMRKVIQQAWGCRAYEEYGAVENCALATECEYGRLHVSMDFGIVEIVDDDGNPVLPGQYGRILCTGLLNDGQILVRYDIGDIGIWDTEPCLCGRNHLPVLREILGRTEDIVIGPDGRKMVRFHGIFINLPHVLAGQVIQEDFDRFIVKVITTDGFDEAETNLIRKRFDERLGPVKVKIFKVSELERTERGKVRAVISHVKK